MKNLIWKLFQKTGNIKYYLLYQELRGNNEKECRRNSHQ